MKKYYLLIALTLLSKVAVPQPNNRAVEDHLIIQECNALQLNDSLSCFSYMDCRKTGASKSQCNKFGKSAEKNTASKDAPSLSSEISKRIKEDDVKKKEAQEYQRLKAEEYQRQQRCYTGPPQPGCPNYRPQYDKNGKRIN